MKLPCEIVQDLLPLYEEKLCSSVSQAAIEEHLQECVDCRALVEGMKTLAEPEIPVETSIEEEAVAKSFRKVYRRWKGSLLAMLLVFPMLLMTINQIRGQGICFTNMDEIMAVRKFAQALEQGDFVKAAACTDYESMYNHIQNLVIAEPDVNGSGYRTVVISDRDWLVTNNFYDEYLRWDDDSQNFWGNIIFNRVQQVMIPEDVWDEITALEPGAVQETEDGELLLQGTLYTCLDTKWGRYIVEKDSGLEKCTTAVDFCNVLEFIPKDIFKEANPDLEKQAWKNYYYLKETYEEAKNMTLEEFTSYMQAKYARELQECADQGFSFESVGYDSSYYGSEWHICYGIRIVCEEGSYPTTIGCTIRNGKINLGSMSHREDFEGHDIVSEALFSHYAN